MPSQFMNHVPSILSVVNKIANLRATESDLEYMATVRDVMKSIGCNYFIPLIDDIVNASKVGENDFAASCARLFLAGFDMVYDCLLETDETREYLPVVEDEKQQEEERILENTVASST